MKRYVSDAIVELLADLDCRYLPLNPGSSFRGLHDSLVNYKVAGVPEPMLCANEAIAVAAAHAYAKATNKVSFTAIHNLVGLMQGTMGVYNAWCDRTPMVVLGGGGPVDPAQRRPVDWFHSASVQGELVRDYVKWDDEPVTAQATLDAIARAHRFAGSVPTGPTYVTLDCRVQEKLADDDLTLPDPAAAKPDPPPAARSTDVSAAVDALLAAELPVVVAGRVGQSPASAALLVELGERLGCALVDERNLNAVPTLHPHNLNGDAALLSEADVIVGVEFIDLNRFAEQVHKGRSGPGPLIISIGQDTLALRSWANAGLSTVPSTSLPASGLVGVGQLLDELRVRGVEPGAPERADRVRRLAERHTQLLEEARNKVRAHRDGDSISAVRLVEAVWEAVKDRPWLLTLRNTRAWPEGIWEFEEGNRFLGHSGGGGVGYGPGAMLGGALAARDRGELPVGIIGDGDFQYGPGMLWTALHHRIPMLVVVNNNRSYYNDEEHQIHMAKMRSRPVENAHVAIRLDEPQIDFAKVAEGYGAVGIGPVTRGEALDEALEGAVARVADGHVAVVDVHTN